MVCHGSRVAWWATVRCSNPGWSKKFILQKALQLWGEPVSYSVGISAFARIKRPDLRMNVAGLPVYTVMAGAGSSYLITSSDRPCGVRIKLAMLFRRCVLFGHVHNMEVVVVGHFGVVSITRSHQYGIVTTWNSNDGLLVVFSDNFRLRP